MRRIEKELLTTYAPQLVGDQAMDFWKQDGITEMEESTEANTVERRINDLVWEDEAAGVISIGREPALIGCVSNFSNFLDLFRKTTRNIELGVPCVVFSRSNTAQHTYRWFELLSDLMLKEGVDTRYLTHVACDVEGQRKIISTFPRSPLYFTGSRPVARAIKEICPNLMASTGGPNTMVCEEWNEAMGEAVMLSASIENSGQCTALRHVVAPATGEDIKSAFNAMPVQDTPKDALSGAQFAGTFECRGITPDAGYTQHPEKAMAYKVNSADALPADDLDEKWREVYVDLTTVDSLANNDFKDRLAAWFIHHQPISLAVNGKTFESAFPLMAYLFERTGMVVNTVGATEKPALTAQAQPQNAEIFGEFPPRGQLAEHTRFPVVGPSSTPGYNAHYTTTYLEAQAAKGAPEGFGYCDGVLSSVSTQTKGYLVTLIEYLADSASGARVSYHSCRTALWGLQTPPKGSGTSIIRVGEETTADALSIYLVPYMITNAREQILVSVPPNNPCASLTESLPESVKVVVEDDADFRAHCDSTSPWNVVEPKADEAHEFSLVGHHVSVLFNLGHVKSTRVQDDDFVKYFTPSPKWLRAVRE